MDIQQIKYFLALAEELHFWKTAGKMNITQSALSRHIQALERELGVQLFERDKRNVKLTAAGEFLKDKWEVEINKLNFIHQSARQIQLGESGTIRISYPDSISASILPGILQNISSAFPMLRIELIQLGYESQQEYLLNYKVDLILTRDITTDKALSSRKIHTEQLCIVVAEQHAFRSVDDLSAARLSEQKFIVTPDGNSSSYNQLIHQVFTTYGIVPHIFLYCEFGSTILALVRKGLGISILPNSYQQHEVPGVRFIQLPFQTDLFLNWRTDDINPVLTNVLKLILN
ncbi:LysR family transcriptional regulator [Pedobacter sp. AW31-3R]|uniref:LysR family transcriptional regulator n=1 Tax=Pedobacter sp. AW31-3R TaxID=3445781 RepID=UPI003F9F3B7D